MTNGNMLDEMRKMLEGENTVPQAVTNRMVVAALAQVYQQSSQTMDALDGFDRRLRMLEERQPNCDERWARWEAKEKAEHAALRMDAEDEQARLAEQSVTFPWLRKEFVTPAMLAIIISLIMGVLGRVIP